MTEKSYVGMGHSLCPVCGIKHDEVVLLDKRLMESLERTNFMGWSLCPEHEALRAEYIALVECSNTAKVGKTLTLGNSERTGQIAHVRRSVAKHIFKDLPDDLPMVFVEVGVIEALKQKTGVV